MRSGAASSLIASIHSAIRSCVAATRNINTPKIQQVGFTTPDLLLSI